jgi:putative transposase
VTARGNRREPIFFEDGDQNIYCNMLAEETRRAGVGVWAYCLMPNHVHLILVPVRDDSLGRAIGEAHRRYSAFINGRAGWSGHLFQGRYASVAMGEHHLLAAVRYVSLNPVRAGLVGQAADWTWSSVNAHLRGEDDGLVMVRPVLDRVEPFADLIDADAGQRFEGALQAVRGSERTGRPLGTPEFLDDLERRLGRPLAPRGRGRKPAPSAVKQPGLF